MTLAIQQGDPGYHEIPQPELAFAPESLPLPGSLPEGMLPIAQALIEFVQREPENSDLPLRTIESGLGVIALDTPLFKDQAPLITDPVEDESLEDTVIEDNDGMTGRKEKTGSKGPWYAPCFGCEKGQLLHGNPQICPDCTGISRITDHQAA